MLQIRLKNPTDKDIISYAIEEATFDADGRMIEEATDPHGYKKTGRTLNWTIKAGETLDFPKYVADYLKKVYDFLEVTPIESGEVPAEEMAKPVGKTVICRHCGKQFTNSKGLALHISAAHPEKL